MGYTCPLFKSGQAVTVNTEAVTVNTQAVTVALPPTIIPGAPLAGLGIAPGSGPNVALFARATNLNNQKRSLDWFATVRGRLGYAFDRLLVYGTGGVAFTDRVNNDNGFVGFGTASLAGIPANFFVSQTAAAPAPAVAASAAAGPFGVGKRGGDDIGVGV